MNEHIAFDSAIEFIYSSQTQCAITRYLSHKYLPNH